MILVHRSSGEPVYLNEDLIETVGVSSPTRIELADGRSIEVVESAEQIVDRAREYRASVIVATERQRAQVAAPAAPSPSVRPIAQQRRVRSFAGTAD